MVRFEPIAYNVNEGEQAVLRVVLSLIADRDVTVDLTTSDRSAAGINIMW